MFLFSNFLPTYFLQFKKIKLVSNVHISSPFSIYASTGSLFLASFWPFWRCFWKNVLITPFLRLCDNIFIYICPSLVSRLFVDLRWNLKNLSRGLNLPNPVKIKRRLKSWNIWYNFKWNQPYLSRGLNLIRRSNSLNSATVV